MTGRDVVLARVRAALRDAPAVPEVPRDYLVRGHLDVPAVVELFAERVDDYRATVHRCGPDGLAEAVAAALGPARKVVVPADLDRSWLSALADGTTLVVDDPPIPTAALDEVDAVVTGAAVAIAETGTIALDAGAGQGRRAITLVPDVHVCVVREGQIVQTVPEGLARLVATRPLTLVSGPSATSDIELDRVEGVHGPRTLHVVVCAG